MPLNNESMPAAESHNSNGGKQDSESRSGRPNTVAPMSSAPSIVQEMGRFNLSTISKTGNMNSKTAFSGRERGDTFSPAPAAPPAEAAPAALSAAPSATAATSVVAAGESASRTASPQPPPAGAPATEAAGPMKSGVHQNTNSTDRGGEFGSSSGAYSRRIFARGDDHRRRGRAYSSTLPPPPPQAPVGVGGGGGWTGLRDLDGYTSSAEADIESMASFASHDSREDDLEATASTDSEVASTASSTGGASSVCSGDSSRNRARDRDLSLELCSSWNEEGKEDILLGLSLARARMTAGKAACSCRETSCFCRFKTTLASSTLARNLSQNPRTVPLPPPGPLLRPELDPRDLALVAEINRMAKGSRDRRESGGGGGRDAGAAPRATPAAAERGAAAGAAAGMRERLAVHMDCAFEFAERFVRRDIALAGRVQAVRLLNCSTNAILAVVVRCGGFRALYGWLGDVWERVRGHKMARAGPPEWMGIGGRVYVEELLCVLARVPITVDMLRETEIARVAKKFRRLAERHGLESMTAASNQLRAHLHALVSRGVQDGLFFRNRAVQRSTAVPVPTDFYRCPIPQQRHLSRASIPYPSQRSEPWNSKEDPAWRANGRAGGAVGFRDSGGSNRGRTYTTSWRGGGGVSMSADVGGVGGGGGSSSNRHDPLPFTGLNMRIQLGHRSVREQRWRWGQGDGDDGGDGASSRGGGSDAGSARGEEEARASDDGKRLTSNHSGSVDGSPLREGGRDELAGEGRQDRGRRKADKHGSRSASTSPAAARSVRDSPDPNSVSGRRSTQASGRASRGYMRRSSSRRRSSKTEPWVLDLSNSGKEDEQRRPGGAGAGAELNSPQQLGYSGVRRGRAGEERGWFRWHGGDNRMFRPVHREEGGGRFSDGRHPSNVSEDGSWESTVDWWPRPQSPTPAGATDAYYTPGDCDSGMSSVMFRNPVPGPQGASSLLPAVPTFEESGTRVSWADHRGHSLAEVHEIEPGYSRGDFALPGHVGFITEACRRDMSKKEKQLLSPEDHERLAAAALESDALRGRAYGGGPGGDSEGTISDSENSITGDPDVGFQSYGSGGGGEARDRSASEDGSGSERRARSLSNPALPHSPASSGGSQDGGSQDGGSQDGGSQDGGHQYGGIQDGEDASECGRSGIEDVRKESGRSKKGGISPRRNPQQSDPRPSPTNNTSRRRNSQNSPETSRPRELNTRREPGDEGGSESGCSSIHSPQRCFSPMEDDGSPSRPSSVIAPQRRFTSPSGRRSPPRSPSVSSPGSSRSGSVADGHVMFESGESSDQSHRDTVCRPPLAHNPWNHHHHEHQQHRPSSREPSPCWENGGTGAEMHLRGTPLSTVSDELMDRGSSKAQGHNEGDAGHRRSRRSVAHSRGGGDDGGNGSSGGRNNRDQVEAYTVSNNVGSCGSSHGSIPRRWELDASASRGKPRWEFERRRAHGRGGGAAEEEKEKETHRSRTTAEMLQGVNNRKKEGNGERVGPPAGTDHHGRGELCGNEEQRSSPPLSPPERSNAPERGRKRFRRDIDEGGKGIGHGCLVPSK